MAWSKLDSNIVEMDEDDFDEIPLLSSVVDRHGYRSMAFQMKKTGEIVPHTQLLEERFTDPVVLNYFRRIDRFWTWYLFEDVRPQFLRPVLRFLSLPLCFLFIGINQTMMYVDRWRFGHNSNSA